VILRPSNAATSAPTAQWLGYVADLVKKRPCDRGTVGGTVDEKSLAEALGDAAREMASTRSESVTAQRIVERARVVLPEADAVSITMRSRRGRFGTLASTSPVAADSDQLQYALAEGPCISAATEDEWFRSGDVGADERWPTWGPQVAARGMNSLLSVSLLNDSVPIGALNFYAAARGVFDAREHVDLAVLYATHAAIALTNVRELSGLTTALHSRHTIGIAQGILMATYDLQVEQSFAVLVRYSNDLNISVATLSEQIVNERALPATGRTLAEE
jgi:GAF domain-containing protein